MQQTEQMREQRVTLEGRLVYEYADGEHGVALWHDVSRVGARIQLGRYLRPGRLVCLEFDSPLGTEAIVTVEVQVVWCRQVAGAPEFVAGLRVRRRTPEEAIAFAALGYAGAGHLNKVDGGAVTPGMWPGFADAVVAVQQDLQAVARAV
jgi:hypothetical protein